MLPIIITLVPNARYAMFAALAVALITTLMACRGGGAPPLTAAAICAATPDATSASVASSDIIEASGLASSRIDDNILWVHNDSGDTARVFAIGRDGALLGTYTLTGAEAVDWEDMAAGPGPDHGVSYLYLADIGDNAAQRSEIDVYRVPEPQVGGNTQVAADLTGVDRLVFHYPDHPHDAETLLVDPDTGDIIIITKELAGGPSFVYRAPASASADAPYTLEQVAQIDFTALKSAAQVPPDAPPLVRGVPFLATGGDVSPAGDLIAIRTYGAIWVWSRNKDLPLWSAFGDKPCEAPSAIEPQGEAIAFDPDGRGYTTTSEGANPPLHHFIAK
jgi:hypothetical protein